MHRATAYLLIVALALLPLAGCGVAPVVVAQGELSVALTTEPAPPLAGRNAILTITVTDEGASFNAGTVGMRRSMPGMEHERDDELVPAEDLGDGRYRASTSFTMGGRWDVAVVVTDHDGLARTIVIPIEVEQP